MTTLLKICGVRRAEDYRACVALGVDSIGLNMWTGSRRYLDPADARALPAPSSAVERVGVFVDSAPDQVLERARALSLDLIQPHGDLPIAAFAGLGLPYTWVIRGAPELAALVRAAPSPAPARILLDAAVPGFGGEGVRTDWGWARRACARLSQIAPVWLAGGITPDNAARAIATVAPAGLDVASGSELAGARRGEKDPPRIAALLAICRGAAPRPAARVQEME